MALYPEPLQAVLDSVEELNPGVVLDKTDYNFGASTPVTVGAGGTNTTLNIAAKNVASPYAGDVTVRHIRLDLADLTTLVPEELAVSGITSTRALANKLNEIYGLNFVNADIVETPVSLTDGSGPVTLVAAAASRGWIGQVTFNIVPGRVDLSTVVTVTRLAGLNYQDPYEYKPFGNAYSYWRNLSAQYALLDVLHAGESGDLVNVKDALVANTGDAWVVSGNSRYSLDGAEILYVGDTAGYPELNTGYGRAVVVKLGPACLGLSGRMFLHYNLPEG